MLKLFTARVASLLLLKNHKSRSRGALKLDPFLVLLATLALSACAELERQGQLFKPNVTVAPPVAGASRETVPVDEFVEQFGGVYRAPVTEAYLNRILQRLAAASGGAGQTAYKVTILNTPVPNAYALPSGNLYVTRGLLALANDASEVAAVMAHEIAHVTARHRALRDERQREAEVITKAAEALKAGQNREEARIRQRLSFASFSRSQEFEADAMGVKVIAAAGFDPYGASRFLTALGRSTEELAALNADRRSSYASDILSEHPSTPERVARAVAAARAISAPGSGERDRAGYLVAIDGVAFGGDPATGFVQGDRYTHGGLRFTLKAPEGFMLKNSAASLRGVGDRDDEVLYLDWVDAPPGDSAKNYLTSGGWIQGLLRSSVKATQINGLKAVTANARAGEFNFRVAVFEHNGRYFRLLFAMHALTEETEKRFDASIASFRPLSGEEVAALRSPRLAIVVAESGDSLDTMARRMATANPPGEYFRLINGLDKDQQLSLGEYYKIVTE
ncbi:M48 family metalloprotease [Methylocystis bryophila]|uniref:M48 family metalloprotease n=1 Tax=Methylocystis bryophila TaxID=655015 RepID=UPI001FD88643|nr:M48 family metalloprotease [Methylocystis bryophila]BDV39920.1 metalloprotease [Methylocystis bryophila]